MTWLHQAQTELVCLPVCPRPNNTLEQNVKRSRRHAITWHFPGMQLPVVKLQSCSKYASALGGTTACWNHHFRSTFRNGGTQEARWLLTSGLPFSSLPHGLNAPPKKGAAQIGRDIALLKCTPTVPLYMWEAHDRQQSEHHHTATRRHSEGRTRKAVPDQSAKPSKKLKRPKGQNGRFEKSSIIILQEIFLPFVQIAKWSCSQTLAQTLDSEQSEWVNGCRHAHAQFRYFLQPQQVWKVTSGCKLWNCLAFAHIGLHLDKWNKKAKKKKH